MCFYSVDSDVESRGNLVIPLAFSNQAYDLGFTVRESG